MYLATIFINNYKYIIFYRVLFICHKTINYIYYLVLKKILHNIASFHYT